MAFERPSPVARRSLAGHEANCHAGDLPMATQRPSRQRSRLLLLLMSVVGVVLFAVARREPQRTEPPGSPIAPGSSATLAAAPPRHPQATEAADASALQAVDPEGAGVPSATFTVRTLGSGRLASPIELHSDKNGFVAVPDNAIGQNARIEVVANGYASTTAERWLRGHTTLTLEKGCEVNLVASGESPLRVRYRIGQVAASATVAVDGTPIGRFPGGVLVVESVNDGPPRGPATHVLPRRGTLRITCAPTPGVLRRVLLRTEGPVEGFRDARVSVVSLAEQAQSEATWRPESGGFVVECLPGKYWYQVATEKQAAFGFFAVEPGDSMTTVIVAFQSARLRLLEAGPDEVRDVSLFVLGGPGAEEIELGTLIQFSEDKPAGTLVIGDSVVAYPEYRRLLAPVRMTGSQRTWTCLPPHVRLGLSILTRDGDTLHVEATTGEPDTEATVTVPRLRFLPVCARPTAPADARLDVLDSAGRLLGSGALDSAACCRVGGLRDDRDYTFRIQSDAGVGSWAGPVAGLDHVTVAIDASGETAVFAVRVIDESDSPVAGMTVLFLPTQGRATYGQTDSHGVSSAKLRAGQDYFANVEQPDWTTKPVRLVSGRATDLRLQRAGVLDIGFSVAAAEVPVRLTIEVGQRPIRTESLAVHPDSRLRLTALPREIIRIMVYSEDGRTRYEDRLVDLTAPQSARTRIEIRL